MTVDILITMKSGKHKVFDINDGHKDFSALVSHLMSAPMCVFQDGIALRTSEIESIVEVKEAH